MLRRMVVSLQRIADLPARFRRMDYSPLLPLVLLPVPSLAKSRAGAEVFA